MKSIKPRGSKLVGPCAHMPIDERCSLCVLDSSDYFSALSATAKLALQQVLRFRTYGRRQLIYAEGDPSAHLYILLSGETKIYKSLSDGRQQIHKLVSLPGDLIACEDLFLEIHSSSAETISETAVCHLLKDDLQSVMCDHAEVTDTLMRSLARHLNSYVRHIANLGQKKASERVASYLIYLCDTHRKRNLHQEILLETLTRTELAEMLGITQRTLIRSLKSLEAQGLISLARDGFIIRDLAALMRHSDGS